MSTPCDHSPFPSYPIDLNQDHQHDHHQQLFFPQSSLPYPALISFNNSVPSQEVTGYYHMGSQPLPHQAEANNIFSGSWDHPAATAVKTENDDGPKSLCKEQGRNDQDYHQGKNSSSSSSVKWMSSKMRLMKKMMRSDQTVVDTMAAGTSEGHKNQPSHMQTDSSSNSSNSCTVRVCSDCNTTKTPLWRSGPNGPKSLCNACGIRQRKARRAMAAAAAAAAAGATGATDFTATDGGRSPPTTKKINNSKIRQREKRVKNSHLPFKKRCKFTVQPRIRKNKLSFEDLPIILSKNSAFQQVFPQDEKEAAILLMALSYGLVHG